jgi:hypothetical protein
LLVNKLGILPISTTPDEPLELAPPSFKPFDGTKTMETGSEKMIYQWNADLNIVTQQTEESKRVGEVLKGLKLGGASSKGSSDAVDIDSIPDTLTSQQIDIGSSIAAFH